MCVDEVLLCGVYVDECDFFVFWLCVCDVVYDELFVVYECDFGWYGIGCSKFGCDVGDGCFVMFGKCVVGVGG